MLERRRLKGYIGDVINDKDNDGNDMLTRNLNGTVVSLAYISDFSGIDSRLWMLAAGIIDLFPDDNRAGE